MIETGFVPWRRGILEHLRRGKILPMECWAFNLLVSLADHLSGVWVGGPQSMSRYGVSERKARELLENLEAKRYIRRFTVPGRHGDYPILVHKFSITAGRQQGKRLNAWASKSFTELSYEVRQHTREETCEETREDGAQYSTPVLERVFREVRIKKGAEARQENKADGGKQPPAREEADAGRDTNRDGADYRVPMRTVRL